MSMRPSAAPHHNEGDLPRMPLVNKPARPKPKLITLDTIEPENMKWLWYPYIPAGTVTAIFGRGGQGKTFMTCAIASALSRGDPLPGQELPAGAKPIPQKVLVLSAEDDYATVLIPRLIKQGANRANIAVPDQKFILDKWGTDQVTELMREFAATVVFIDPIVYYAGGKMDMNKSNEVRSMMEGLKDAAEKTGSSVIIVGHIRKSDEGDEADRMMGSADWVNAARSGVLVTTTNDGTKVMKHVKTNYGVRGLAQTFEIDDDGFHWREAFDADDLPAKSSPKRKETAVVFLRNILADGPVPSKEVEQAAADNNIAVATLNRAKVGVAESFYSKSKGWMWQLLGATDTTGGEV